MKKLLTGILLALPIMAIAQSPNQSNNGYLKNGKMYLYEDNKNNVITCKVQQLCNIALVKGDKFENWIITDGSAWNDSVRAKITYTDADTGVQHVVIQAVEVSKNNIAYLISSQRQYRFNLVANTASPTNEYVFIQKEQPELTSNNAVIDDGLDIDLKNKKIDAKYYTKGDTDSSLMPVQVFNDGTKTYIKLSDNIDTTDAPVAHSFDDNGRLTQLNNARYRKPYVIIDNLVPRIALTSGSVDNDNPVRVDIYRGDQPSFWRWLMLQYDRG